MEDFIQKMKLSNDIKISLCSFTHKKIILNHPEIKADVDLFKNIKPLAN